MGRKEGVAIGDPVGVGVLLGMEDGRLLYTLDGAAESLGLDVGRLLRSIDGLILALGVTVSTTEGWMLGCKVGGEDGRSEYDGFDVGALTGLVVGRKSHMDSTRTPTKSFKSLKA